MLDGLTPQAVRKDGLLDLAQACRRLSALRELEVTGTAKDGGYTDFLLPQVRVCVWEEREGVCGCAALVVCL